MARARKLSKKERNAIMPVVGKHTPVVTSVVSMLKGKEKGARGKALGAITRKEKDNPALRAAGQAMRDEQAKRCSECDGAKRIAKGWSMVTCPQCNGSGKP
jgi:hypothetical protein